MRKTASILTLRPILILTAAAAWGFGGLPGAHADTLFTDQVSFSNAIAPTRYLETFNSLSQNSPLASLQAFSQNGFSYSASSTSAFFNVGPAGDTWLSTVSPDDTIIFTLTGGNATAVGGYFFLTDQGGAVTTGNVVLTLDDGSTFTRTNATATSFIGFTTTAPISSFTITPGSGTYSTVNNLTVGVVPEPSTYALVLGSLGLRAQRARLA